MGRGNRRLMRKRKVPEEGNRRVMRKKEEWEEKLWSTGRKMGRRKDDN